MPERNGLLHELWEDDGAGVPSTLFCLAGPRGAAARATLSENAQLIWTVWAGSHHEAMTLHHQRLGPEPHQSDEDWDNQPYPQEWIVEQQVFLAQHAKRSN